MLVAVDDVKDEPGGQQRWSTSDLVIFFTLHECRRGYHIRLVSISSFIAIAALGNCLLFSLAEKLDIICNIRWIKILMWETLGSSWPVPSQPVLRRYCWEVERQPSGEEAFLKLCQGLAVPVHGMTIIAYHCAMLRKLWIWLKNRFQSCDWHGCLFICNQDLYDVIIIVKYNMIVIKRSGMYNMI